MTAEARYPQAEPIREASRRLVRELGFMRSTLAGTRLPPSAVHALLEIGTRESVTAGELCDLLALEKSSTSRMLQKLVASGDIREGLDEQDGRAKPLSLTAKGQATLAAVNGFARRQLTGALDKLRPEQHQTVADGLSLYAAALLAGRTGKPSERVVVEIETGYRPGTIGRCAEMHARFYTRMAGFGRPFEAGVAAGLAEFSARLDKPGNCLWLAIQAGVVVGTIAIDGEDMGPGIAHLRWFIVDDGIRGGGIGRRMLSDAIGFCDRQGFAEIHLWTFLGLDSARRLYEAQGFSLVEERPGWQWGKEVMEQRFVRRAKPMPPSRV